MGFCQDPTKTTTTHDCAAPLRTVIRNRNRLFYSESTAKFCLHVRGLCPASPQRLQRLCDGSPTLTRTLFFAFFLSLRALNFLRVINCMPFLIIKVSYCYTRFLLYNVRLLEASLAAWSSALRLVINTRECAIISAPFDRLLIASTIYVGELSTCLRILS